MQHVASVIMSITENTQFIRSEQTNTAFAEHTLSHLRSSISATHQLTTNTSSCVLPTFMRGPTNAWLVSLCIVQPTHDMTYARTAANSR